MPERWPLLIAACAAPLWNRGRIDEAERTAALAMELSPTEPHGWIQGTYAASSVDRALAYDRAREAVRLSGGRKSHDVIPAFNVLCIAARANGNLGAAEKAARQLVVESVRFGSATGQCAGELCLASVLPPGTPQAAAQAKRAIELATSGRATMMQVVATAAYIDHALGFDRARAEAALLEFLQDPVANSEVSLSNLALAVAARFHATTGNTELAMKLGRGVPFAVLNRNRRNPAVKAMLVKLADERSISDSTERAVDHDLLLGLAISGLDAN